MKAKYVLFCSIPLFLALVLSWPLVIKRNDSLTWQRLERNVKAVGRSSFHKSLFYSDAKEHLVMDVEIFKLLMDVGFNEIKEDGLTVKYYFETDEIKSNVLIDYYVEKEEEKQKFVQNLIVRKEY